MKANEAHVLLLRTGFHQFSKLLSPYAPLVLDVVLPADAVTFDQFRKQLDREAAAAHPGWPCIHEELRYVPGGEYTLERVYAPEGFQIVPMEPIDAV